LSLGRTGAVVDRSSGVVVIYPSHDIEPESFSWGSACFGWNDSLFSRVSKSQADDRHREKPMPEIHEHHEKAAHHHEQAAKQHREAAKHHKSGAHEKAAHHSKLAHGHHLHATEHHEHASKKHVEKHDR
jgi:hypothetical protein